MNGIDAPARAPRRFGELLRRRFRDQPLSVKLGLLFGACAAMTAVVISSTLFAMTWWSLAEDAEADVGEVAGSLAYSLRAPLAFENTADMQDALDVTRARPQVRGAWVRDRDGRLAASIGEAPEPPGPNIGGLLAGHTSVQRPIVSREGGEVLGSVLVEIDLSEQRNTLLAMAGAAAVATLGGLALSLGISRRLSRRVTAPVLDLAETATAIASGRTYDRRLRAAGDDEVGRAVQAFNAMIDEVERRGDALTRMNHALERQVDAHARSAERAEAASLAKTRFLSNMSHELRSPLNGVIGAAQLLQEGTLDADRRDDLVRIIRTSGANLLGLIDSILDLARIESGAMSLDEAPFDLLECIGAAMATSAVPARTKGLQMAAVVEASVPSARHGDALRLRQVLLNLLGNAVKFTLQGEVVLRVKVGRQPGELMFQVSDTGIGMDEEALGTIFDPFRQADDATTRRFGGSGLGLTICRQVVELMGGTIDVESTPGAGSRFTVTVPLPVVGEPAAPPAQALPVFCWEPHDASAEALLAMATRHGHRAVRFASPQAALAEAEASGGWLFVAADAPGGTGLLEAAAGRLAPGHAVAMTGAEATRHPRHWPSSVTKPVLPAALAARLHARPVTAVPAPAVPPTAPGHPDARIRVLVVEDEPVNQAIVGSMLSQAGFAVVMASDGAEALETFGRETFDLVLMDWQMPDMDGLEVTRRLRAGAVGAHGTRVPILALTANAFAEDRAACMAAGMNDFLTKPVLAADLVGAAMRWTKASQGGPGR